MFGKTSAKFGRSASVSISKDFEHWSEPVLCFATDEEDQKMAKQIIRKGCNRLSAGWFGRLRESV